MSSPAQDHINAASMLSQVRKTNHSQSQSIRQISLSAAALVVLFLGTNPAQVQAKTTNSSQSGQTSSQNQARHSQSTQDQGIPGTVVSVRSISSGDLDENGQVKTKKSQKILTGAGKMIGGLLGEKAGGKFGQVAGSLAGDLAGSGLGGKLSAWRDKSKKKQEASNNNDDQDSSYSKIGGDSPSYDQSLSNKNNERVLKEIVVRVKIGSNSQDFTVVQEQGYNLEAGDQVAMVNDQNQISVYPKDAEVTAGVNPNSTKPSKYNP